MEEDSVDVICAQCQKLLTHLYYLVLFYQPLKYWLRNPTVKPWTAGLLA